MYQVGERESDSERNTQFMAQLVPTSNLSMQLSEKGTDGGGKSTARPAGARGGVVKALRGPGRAQCS